MDLQLAVVLSCTGSGCRVQLLGSGVRIDAPYSEPMVDNGISAGPGQLVAVDTGAEPAQLVFRWDCFEVSESEGDHVLTRDGCPVRPEEVEDEFFATIQAMYRSLEAYKQVDPKQLVEQGYDRIAERHLAWGQETRSEERARYTALLLDGLPPGAEVLELGCGAGIPTTQALAERFRVTGVDISARQIELARQNAPQARLIRADITELDFPRGSFDGVAAFYSLIHVPCEEQAQLLPRVAQWLRPGACSWRRWARLR